MRLDHQTMADELQKLVSAKENWINDFTGPKHPRPEWEVSIRKKELEVLRQARGDYRAAARRTEAAA